MSDRRSFSEIPADLLRDHGVDARVERIWKRLEQDVVPSRTRARSAPRLAVLAAIGTFLLGVFVGTRLSSREPVPLTAFEAEPASAPRPATATPKPAAATPRTRAAAPHATQVHRAAPAHHVDSVAALPAEPSSPAAVSLSGPAEWQRLADEGDYAGALTALDSAGGFDVALHDASADQLMALVDVARGTGQRDRALVALRRIVSEHGADPNAPVAAWMLGNELAKIHDLAGAEQAFAMYRALSPGGDFAEDALARQIDMAADQGNLEHAKKLAGQYLKEFPDGPRTAEIQTRIEQWSEEPLQVRAEAERPNATLPADAGTLE